MEIPYFMVQLSERFFAPGNVRSNSRAIKQSASSTMMGRVSA
jgi:hypothetical protein